MTLKELIELNQNSISMLHEMKGNASILFANDDCDDYDDIARIIDFKLEEHQMDLSRAKDLLKAEQEKYNPNWKPACGEKYWTINNCGVVIFCFRGISDTKDNWRFINQIVFKTEAQCEKGKQAVELIAEIKEDNRRYNKTYIMLIVSSLANDSEYITYAMNSTKIDEVFGDRIKALKEYL